MYLYSILKNTHVWLSVIFCLFFYRAHGHKPLEPGVEPALNIDNTDIIVPSGVTDSTKPFKVTDTSGTVRTAKPKDTIHIFGQDIKAPSIKEMEVFVGKSYKRFVCNRLIFKIQKAIQLIFKFRSSYISPMHH